MRIGTLLSIWIISCAGHFLAAQQLQFTQQQLPFTGQGKCVVDMNGDFLDDVVKVLQNSIVVATQTGSGFVVNTYPTETAAHTPSWSIAAGDVDGNGYNDLLYGGGQGTSFMIANSNGTSFTQQTGTEYVFSQRTNFVDINNDGHLDAFVCHDVAPNVYYINDGNGVLQFNQGGIGDVVDGGNYGSLWVDHDNDGDLEVFLSKCTGGVTMANINQLFQNNGDGTFTDVAPQLGLDDDIQTWSTAWGDLDNDMDMDMMIGVFSFVNGGHKLLRNNGNGTYTDITAGSGFDTNTASGVENVTHDFDNDGDLDIFGAGGAAVGGMIMMNNGDLTFTPEYVPMNHGPIGDLNNDGFLDVVNNSTAYFGVDNGNNWVKFNTIGTVSNYNGIGARIEVTSATGTRIREVRSGEGFGFMSSLNVHFGLGGDAAIEQVVIRWPSGIVDVLYDQQVNTTISVVEGSTGTVAIDDLAPEAISLYPIPASDRLFIGGLMDTRPPVWIFDPEGRLIAQLPIVESSIDVSGLKPGAYLLYLSDQGKLVRKRFVKV